MPAPALSGKMTTSREDNRHPIRSSLQILSTSQLARRLSTIIGHQQISRTPKAKILEHNPQAVQASLCLI